MMATSLVLWSALLSLLNACDSKTFDDKRPAPTARTVNISIEKKLKKIEEAKSQEDLSLTGALEDANYIGCYRQGQMPTMQPLDAATDLGSCLRQARENSYRFLALQSNDTAVKCFVSDEQTFATEKSSHDECPKNSGVQQGDGQSLAVFERNAEIPQGRKFSYLGCWSQGSEGIDLAPVDTERELSAAECRLAALNSKARFFALQQDDRGEVQCLLSQDAEWPEAEDMPQSDTCSAHEAHQVGGIDSRAIYQRPNLDL